MYWFFKTPESTGTTENVDIKVVQPVKVDIVLSEAEDEEKQQFYKELADQKRRSSYLAAESRARHLANLPKKFDSMEMISAEASFGNRLAALVNGQRNHISKVLDQAKNIKYGHSQYSDSESEMEEGVVKDDVPVGENAKAKTNESDTSSSESEEVEEDAYVRYIIGEHLEKDNKPMEEDEDNYEVVDKPHDY